MGLLISCAATRQTRLANIDAELYVMKITCDNNYVTGGYDFNPDHYAPFHVHDARAVDCGGYSAAWDRMRNKLLVLRGGNEVRNGTDLSGIEFVIQLWKYGKFSEPVLAQTEPIQSGTGGSYLRKDADDSILAGTTSWESGTTLKLSSGASQTFDTGSIRSIKGATIREGAIEITADNQNIGHVTNLAITPNSPDNITKFTGAIRHGQIWHLTASAAKVIYDGVRHSVESNIILPGNVDFETGNGDEYQLRFDASIGKYIFEIIHLNT